MYNEAQNLSRLLHFTESLCDFADGVVKYHNCQFNIEIDNDKFKFDLSELITQIRKYRQAVIDDLKNFSDDERSDEVADEPKSIIAEPFVPDSTAETSSDEITISDFDDVRKGMSDTVKTVFDLLLPLSIIEEENGHKKLSDPKPKSERIKAIEMYTMLRMAKIAVS